MKKITGVMIYYYFVCKRKLWFFSKDLNMEHDSDLVGMGKLIDETSYIREKKGIIIDESINIDFVKNWKIIHEVKKSRKLNEASKWQVKYYIWLLNEYGINIQKGILDYPLLRKREEIFLNEDDKDRLQSVLMEIKNIISLDTPPEINNKSICKKCAYYELCYI